MTTPAVTALPVISQSIPTPRPRGIKKVLTGGRRSSEARNGGGSGPGSLVPSVDGTALERSPSRKSGESSQSRDGSSKSGSSGIRKLLPGHAKRKRRRIREEELRMAIEDTARGRSSEAAPQAFLNRSTTSLTQDGDGSMLTDDSEPDMPPPLVSRDSHAVYLTTSSPLVTTTTFDGSTINGSQNTAPAAPAEGLSSIVNSDLVLASPALLPASESTPVPPMPGLIDKADTLRLDAADRTGRRGSISKSLASISPARRLKEVFVPTKSSKSARESPERKAPESFTGSASSLLGKGGIVNERKLSKIPDKNAPSSIETGADSQLRTAPTDASPILLDTNNPPRTPPGAGLSTPVTTVTPPTPTEPRPLENLGSPRRNTESPFSRYEVPELVVSPSGNMISHRRTRSTSSLTHQPSKLSNSAVPPLTPTVEEAKSPADKGTGSRNVTPGGSFFSSWVSVAQNAASSITSTLNTQNRNRSGASNSDASKARQTEESIKEEIESVSEAEEPKKQLAVETLGMGDLNFGHLGIDSASDERGTVSLRPEIEQLRKDSTVRRDEAAAKIEEMLAKRAVHAAYEKSNEKANERSNEHTPTAEVADPINGIKHAKTMPNNVADDHATTNTNVVEADSKSVKRSNSVRSKIHRRRSRGSSAATGTTIGALAGSSSVTLASPAVAPRLSGFSLAPKQRNRTFHQQFRTVPEDDHLIEDYSCALQREILLAGRIYISEGHICFSSNILGWVTTLVISFEEVVSIERETTAMVFPNAIAIQTLHARHTFRSLLSREATFDLLIGIWKVSHPASFLKSVNGRQMLEKERDVKRQTETVAETQADDGSEEGSEGSRDDESDEESYEEGVRSFVGSEPSLVEGGELADGRSVTRKSSALNGTVLLPTGAAGSGASDAVSATQAANTEPAVDFPGPVTHVPTECSDGATHYEKVLKDEIIPAPLGKVYSMLYGSASTAFMRKFLTEEQKVMDLQLEDDKKGLTNESKTRVYTYIKPLGGSIGPKQTKCVTTENLDFFDLEKSVSVTCTTQTPDVPSGNAFSVKTRYCLSWAPGNATRFQMNCGIEWTAKSWLKGPIEKGANEGQLSYGDGLVRVLRAGLSRSRAGTTGTSSKGVKPSRKRKTKGEKGLEAGGVKVQEAKKVANWGVLEPLRAVLGSVVDIVKPLATSPVGIGVIIFLIMMLWFNRLKEAPVGAIGRGRDGSAERIAAYEELWLREESELWQWLEERIGVDQIALDGSRGARGWDAGVEKKWRPQQKPRSRQRPTQPYIGWTDVDAQLREEKMSEREIEDAIRVTRQRLDELTEAVERRKRERKREREREQEREQERERKQEQQKSQSRSAK